MVKKKENSAYLWVLEARVGVMKMLRILMGFE